MRRAAAIREMIESGFDDRQLRSADGSLHEARALERLDLRGRRCERQAIRLRELAHGTFPFGELPEHSAPGAVTEGAKDEIERRWIFNMAEYRTTPGNIVNPLVE